MAIIARYGKAQSPVPNLPLPRAMRFWLLSIIVLGEISHAIPLKICIVARVVINAGILANVTSAASSNEKILKQLENEGLKLK